MSGMRRQVLLRSIVKYLRPNEKIRHAAQVWQRHRLMFPFGIASFVVLAIVGVLSGLDGVILPVAVGAAGASVAVTATTSHTIVVLTDRELVLLRGSRIRAVATGPLKRLPDTTLVQRTGGSMIVSDWRIGKSSYSASKAHEQQLTAIEMASR